MDIRLGRLCVLTRQSLCILCNVHNHFSCSPSIYFSVVFRYLVFSPSIHTLTPAYSHSLPSCPSPVLVSLASCISDSTRFIRRRAFKSRKIQGLRIVDTLVEGLELTQEGLEKVERWVTEFIYSNYSADRLTLIRTRTEPFILHKPMSPSHPFHPCILTARPRSPWSGKLSLN